MIIISKPKLAIILALATFATVSVLSLVALAYAEGVYHDPEGQLNDSFKLACDSGILADRSIMISEDGEYNWMFAKGQELIVRAQLDTVQNNSIVLSLIDWSKPAGSNVIKTSTLHTSSDMVDWTISLPHSGHWQLELVNYSGLGVQVRLYIIAGPNGNLGLLNCLNPGDLFRFDSD